VDTYHHEKEKAEYLSSIVQWVIIKGGKQVPFAKHDNRKIEQAYKSKENDLKIKIKNVDYQVNWY